MESGGHAELALPAVLAASIDERVMASWQAVDPAELARLGRRLRDLGLNERALSYVFGVSCPAHVPLRARATLDVDAGVDTGHGLHLMRDVAPAGLMAHLWVAGTPLSVDRVRARLGQDFEMLTSLGLVRCEGPWVRATVAMVPVGQALVVSDRADVAMGRHIALFADDSAFHTLGAVRERAARPRMQWLDVGTGSAIVPLGRPGAAAAVLGTDVNPRAIAMARLGAHLSAMSHIELEVADLLGAAGARAPWDLITFNAPIPEGAAHGNAETPWYRQGDADILVRFWSGVRELVAREGEVIVHSVLPDSDDPASLDLPGRVIVASYTPPGQSPAFGITWWQPAGPSEYHRIALELTPDTPHIRRVQ